MQNRPIGLLTVRLTAALLALLVLALAGCDIQKTEPPHTGSIYVTLTIGDSTADTLLSGARIRVDGHLTTRLTPALITGISTGPHTVSAFKPGFLDTSLSVDVTLNAIDTAALRTDHALDGAIDLIGAPDGTVLLVNNMPVDTVPVNSDTPTLFQNIGLGTFEVSAYASGFATEAPSKWTVQITPGSTVSLAPVFVPVAEGFEVGDLAPDFELRSDWGNTTYRLQDYRGKVCLVSFFFYTCSACIEEFPYIGAMYNDPRYAGKLQFFGVDFTDSYSKFAQFRDDHPSLDLRFPLLHDPRQTVKSDYNVFACPANFVVDATGRIRLVQGGISQPLLHQTVDAALEASSAPTFDFSMRDTLLAYNDTMREMYHEFHGELQNLLNAPRTFIYNVTPISYPDTARHTSICTYVTCYRAQAGILSLNESYRPLQVDTAVGFILYNMKNYWQGDSLWTDTSSFVGDYVLDVTVYPADNATESTTWRLHLHDAGVGLSVRAESWPPTTLSTFYHPVNR